MLSSLWYVLLNFPIVLEKKMCILPVLSVELYIVQLDIGEHFSCILNSFPSCILPRCHEGWELGAECSLTINCKFDNFLLTPFSLPVF